MSNKGHVANLARLCAAHNLEVFRVSGKEARELRAEYRQAYNKYRQERNSYRHIEAPEPKSFDDWLSDDMPGRIPPRAGWYRWSCSPGCIPDSDRASGPFTSYTLAAEDATDGIEE